MKRQRHWTFVLRIPAIICLVLVSLAFAHSMVAAWVGAGGRRGEGAEEAAHTFLAFASDESFDRAYAMTAVPFQRANGRADFERFVRETVLGDQRGATFTSRRWSYGGGLPTRVALEGMMHHDSGPIRLHMTMYEEAAGWRVARIGFEPE